MSFSKKVIAITGAASGIGLATARILASKGAILSLADFHSASLQALATELQQAGHLVYSEVVDVSNRAAVEAWTKNTVNNLGKIDGLATLAGTPGKGMLREYIEDINDDDWDSVFDINVKGTLNSLRAQIPHFSDGGSIVTVASLLGVSGQDKNSVYASSKHAVVGLSRCAAQELGRRNIRVNCLCP